MRTEGKGELKKWPCVGSGEFDSDKFVFFRFIDSRQRIERSKNGP
jgi:hypothetical protein